MKHSTCLRTSCIAIVLIWLATNVQGQKVIDTWITEFKTYEATIDSCLKERKVLLPDGSSVLHTFRHWNCDSTKEMTSHFDPHHKLLSQVSYPVDSSGTNGGFNYTYDEHNNPSGIEVTYGPDHAKDTFLNTYNEKNVLIGYTRIGGNGKVKGKGTIILGDNGEKIKEQYEDDMGTKIKVFSEGLLREIIQNGSPEEEYIYDGKGRLISHFFKRKYERQDFIYIAERLSFVERFNKVRGEYTLIERDVYHYDATGSLARINTFKGEQLIKKITFITKVLQH